MKCKIAIVGSKSLSGYDYVYRLIDKILSEEGRSSDEIMVVNGGEDGVDTMAAEVALSYGLGYEEVPLQECQDRSGSCQKKNARYCFEHSYKPRSFNIAKQASKIYRIYEEGCMSSTCEVTARFGEELGKKVVRIPVDILSIPR